MRTPWQRTMGGIPSRNASHSMVEKVEQDVGGGTVVVPGGD